MKSWTNPLSLALSATAIAACLGAESREPPDYAARLASPPFLGVCTVPLSHTDALLDRATDSYLAAPARDTATAAAIDMAVTLQGIFGEYQAGHFGPAYRANAVAIESLAVKRSPEHVTSAEIRAVQDVRSALYADTVVALQAAAPALQSPKVAAAYQRRAAVLDSVISNIAAPQQMRTAERLAVCEVLAAYRNP